MASAAAALTSRQDGEPDSGRAALIAWKREQERINTERYGSDLYSESAESALQIAEVKPVFSPGFSRKARL